MKSWYQFKNETSNPTVADIHITDYIGSWDDEWFRQFGYDMGVTAKSFIDELGKLPASVTTIRVHINSPGGDVFGGLNIANALRDQVKTKGRAVETIIDGLAASIASVIAMAGSTVTMADNALMMVHNPFCVAIGNAAELRKTADTLDTITSSLIATYQWHSTLTAEEISALLSADTWMTAAEAKEKGFATDVVEGLKAAASIGSMGKLKIPAEFEARVRAFMKPAEPPAAEPVAATALEVMDACEAAGCAELARELITAKATSSQVAARLTEAKAAKTAAAARAEEITAVCATAKMPQLAAGYIRGGMTTTDVRAHLTEITARVGAGNIDTTLAPSDGARADATLSPSAIYAERNAKRQ